MTEPVSADRKSRESQNKSAARLRVVSEKGDLYAAASADGCWIKIGFSTRLSERLKAINAEYQGAPFKLIGSTLSTYRVEQQIHRALRPLHQLRIAAGKELYPSAPAVQRVVDAMLRQPTLEVIDLDDLLSLFKWCREQAQLPENKRPAYIAHARRFDAIEAAERRSFDRLALRIARRAAA